MCHLNNVQMNLINHKINGDEGQTALISCFVNFLVIKYVKFAFNQFL